MLHSGRSLVLLSLILSLMAFLVTAEADNAAPPSEEDDNSSSEETVEDSNESRRKRSLEATSGENTNKGGDGKLAGKAGIPGLPDPATILKIVEILQTLGEKVVPILVEGNSVANLVAERVGENYELLKDFKKEIDFLTDALRSKK